MKRKGDYSIFTAICIAVTLFFNIVFTASAYAYIDPNTGGFFFQTIAPFVYGFLGLIVVFWKRISGFAKGLFSRKKDPPNSSQDD